MIPRGSPPATMALHVEQTEKSKPMRRTPLTREQLLPIAPATARTLSLNSHLALVALRQGYAASGSAAPATGRKANRALRRQVYNAIAKHKEISAGNISVVARDGAVTLNGTVTNASQVGTVAEIAKSVPGVISVTNKLTVEQPFGGQ
jgi:hyperosmotically inducible periplasmic protein